MISGDGVEADGDNLFLASDRDMRRRLSHRCNSMSVTAGTNRIAAIMAQDESSHVSIAKTPSRIRIVLKNVRLKTNGAPLVHAPDHLGDDGVDIVVSGGNQRADIVAEAHREIGGRCLLAVHRQL